MPCDTVQTTDVEIGRMNPVLLADALADLGYQVTAKAQGRLVFHGQGVYSGQYQNGNLYTEGATIEPAELKRAYSARLVRHQAKRAGFKVVQTADQNRFILRRG